jgi:hypothetical protein
MSVYQRIQDSDQVLSGFVYLKGLHLSRSTTLQQEFLPDELEQVGVVVCLLSAQTLD